MLKTDIYIFQDELDEINRIINSEKNKKKQEVIKEQYAERIEYLRWAIACCEAEFYYKRNAMGDM